MRVARRQRRLVPASRRPRGRIGGRFEKAPARALASSSSMHLMQETGIVTRSGAHKSDALRGGKLERRLEERRDLRASAAGPSGYWASRAARGRKARARRPAPLHGGRRDVEGLRGFFYAEPAEVAQLHETRLLGVERRQPFERRVDASTSTPRARRCGARASFRVTRSRWPPRLAACRARARSTRICRITLAAMARKCARLCGAAGACWPTAAARLRGRAPVGVECLARAARAASARARSVAARRRRGAAAPRARRGLAGRARSSSTVTDGPAGVGMAIL